LFETGWFYSKLTDVVVRRLKKQTSASNEGSAILVLQDGCRNPAYRVRFLRRFSIDLILFSFPLNNVGFFKFILIDHSDTTSAKRRALVVAQQFQLSRFPLPGHG
jgi:hypothetical protein